jgi:hypothetical protein
MVSVRETPLSLWFYFSLYIFVKTCLTMAMQPKHVATLYEDSFYNKYTVVFVSICWLFNTVSSFWYYPLVYIEALHIMVEWQHCCLSRRSLLQIFTHRSAVWSLSGTLDSVKTIPKIGPWPSPSVSFPLHYSLFTPSLNAVYYELEIIIKWINYNRNV